MTAILRDADLPPEWLIRFLLSSLDDDLDWLVGHEIRDLESTRVDDKHNTVLSDYSPKPYLLTDFAAPSRVPESAFVLGVRFKEL